MNKDRTCKYCNKIFKKISGSVFANHVRWCPENKTNGDKGSKSIKEARKKEYDLKYGEKKQYVKQCKNCGKDYYVYCRKTQLNNGKVVKQCCSSKCAHSVGGKLSIKG